jgi:hypothetical protein
MPINQISSANTFEQWLIATQQLIAFANSVTNSGSSGSFTSNTAEYIITGNLVIGNTVTCVTMNTDVIIFDDGTRLTSNAQIVNSYNHANGAFNKANAANVLAQQAYDYANTIALGGEIAGDNVQVLYAVVGNTINANVSMSTPTITVTSNVIFGDGTRLTSNVQIVNSYNHANAAFDKANSSNVLAQQAYDYSNTITTGVVASAYNHANGAFNKANSANVLAQQAYDYANTIATGTAGGAYDQANAAFNKANSANVLAQQAYDYANTIATGTAGGAYDQANAAFNKANSANLLAQQAYNYANTIALGGEISGDNVTVLYTVTGNNIVANTNITTNTMSANLITAVDVNTTSDLTLKTNIMQISNSLDVLDKITGLAFNWKSDGTKSYGVSAQEVEQVLPEIVKMRDDGFKGVSYLTLVAFLIEATKDLKKEVTKIKNYINID